MVSAAELHRCLNSAQTTVADIYGRVSAVFGTYTKRIGELRAVFLF